MYTTHLYVHAHTHEYIYIYKPIYICMSGIIARYH